jgi:predicted nucleic acid-binding protein
MTTLFADTFYWIALADTNDSAHRLALTLTTDRGTSQIVTTDEVLTEYLNFFSSGPEQFRRKAAHGVERLLRGAVVRVVPQSRDSFSFRSATLRGAARQRLQPDGLHFHADDAPGRADRRSHQRPAF